MKSHKLFFPGALPLAASRGRRIYIYIYLYTHVATKQINTNTHTHKHRVTTSQMFFFALWPCRSCSCTASLDAVSVVEIVQSDCCHRFGWRVILSGSRQWVQSIPSIPASHEGPAPAEKMRLQGLGKVAYRRCGMMWNKRRKCCRQYCGRRELEEEYFL